MRGVVVMAGGLSMSARTESAVAVVLAWLFVAGALYGLCLLVQWWWTS